MREKRKVYWSRILDIKPYKFFIEIHKVVEEFFGPSNFTTHLTKGNYINF